MTTHKPDQNKRHKANKQARYQRRVARRKMYKGLTAPRGGFVKLMRKK